MTDKPKPKLDPDTQEIVRQAKEAVKQSKKLVKQAKELGNCHIFTTKLWHHNGY